jgi:putative tributyrin esterase
MSVFKTIEVSNPRFEREHLRFITVRTNTLAGRADICVFVPPGTEQLEDIPVVLLLHGVYGSAWSWSHCSGVHLQAMQMIATGELPNMIIAMPSDGLWGDGSAYLPQHEADYEAWIVRDVPQALKEVFPQVSVHSPFFIAGLSMGGFGALRLGVKYNHIFRAVAAHSSITDLSQMKLFTRDDPDHYLPAALSDTSVLTTILRYQDALPAIRFDCGRDDLLIAFNRDLKLALDAHQIDHIYEEFDGGHEWPYWEKHVSGALRFFAQYL